MNEHESSDQSAPVTAPKTKRVFRPLTEEQWKLARITFETGDKSLTLAKIALQFNTSRSMVEKRSASEKWSKGQAIVQSVRKEMTAALQDTIAIEARKAGEKAGREIAKELQPWIEREKRHHIRRAIKRSKTALRRLDRVADGYQVYDAKRGELVDCETNPKDEMMIASAEDKYDGIIRRNLGMGDSDSAPAASLSLRVITQGGAIELTHGA